MNEECWQKLSLAEQLGNIGGEVHRAVKEKGVHGERYENAVVRALELFDCTFADPRWRGARRKEIGRVREVFCDAALGGGMYKTTLEDLDRYFFGFAEVAMRFRQK
ncbi:hypothetical protein HY504_00030 [Candidatus Wolfebacteria bacterium]|nr:hypothetical protein [Candidatus Wolfebacteria bacterium]